MQHIHFENTTLMNAINAGLIVLDKECKVVFWNNWIEKYSGIPIKNALSKKLLELFPELENNRVFHAVNSNLELGMPAVISNVLNRSPFPLYSRFDKRSEKKNRLLQHIQITRIVGFQVDDKNPKNSHDAFYCLLYITDVTASVLRETVLENQIIERKVAEEALQETRRIAEVANFAKSQFLANMSHEIRTPLNGIMGMVELLKDCSMDEEGLSFVETLFESSKSLLLIVNDVLDYSKFESKQSSLTMNSFSFKEIIHYIDRIMRIKATQKNLSFCINIPEDMPDKVLGDKVRLRQILVNLLENAIKFTHEGTVSLNLTVHSQTSSNVTIDIDVEDTGIGIAKENLSKIFDSFLQADNSFTREYGGTGLGLAISKQLVELMGGELMVKSTLGKGTVFNFTAILGIETT